MFSVVFMGCASFLFLGAGNGKNIFLTIAQLKPAHRDMAFTLRGAFGSRRSLALSVL